jgi:LCP family protein required for cell wall assembly
MANFTEKTQPVPLAGSKSNILVPGCAILISAVICIGIIGVFYLIFPPRVNLLIIGIDETPEGTYLGRTDTIIVATVQPLNSKFGLLSIPRDLWVHIPGVGENRINSAHIFAELEKPGSGPFATLETVQQNFGIDVEYYVRIRFDGFEQIIDAMDGVNIELTQPMAGYQTGVHQLDGQSALAFVRDRSGTDDFYRMERGQLFLKAIFKQLANPDQWENIPAVIQAVADVVDTNMPVWHWPRLILTFLLVGVDGVDNHVITRDMVDPFTTAGGAQVLAPDWEKINPLIVELFGNQEIMVDPLINKTD